MLFSHFVKPHSQRVLSRPYLLAFMAHGAAVFGANCQPGFDTIYPFLFSGSTDLSIKKLGFVIVQVKKNDISQESCAAIFKKMDPFACGLLKHDQYYNHFPIPIVCIVFTLCSNESELTLKTYSSPLEGASYLDGDGQPCFTSYNY